MPSGRIADAGELEGPLREAWYEFDGSEEEGMEPYKLTGRMETDPHKWHKLAQKKELFVSKRGKKKRRKKS